MFFKRFNPVKSASKRLQRSIQTKLAFVLVFVGFISLSSLGLLSIYLGSQEVQTEVGKRNHEVAALVSGQVDSFLTGVVSDLKFAASYFSSPDTSSDLPLYVFRLLKKNSDQTYRALGYIDRNGVRRSFYAGSPGSADQPGNFSILAQQPTDMSSDPVYLTTKNGQSYFSKVYLSPTKEPVMLVAVPVQDSNEAYLGSLIVEVNLARLTEVAQTVKTDQTTEASLLDQNGTVFISSNAQLRGLEFGAKQISEMRQSDKANARYTDEDGKLYFVGYAEVKNQPGWTVVVSQAASEALSGIIRLAIVALCVVIVAIIGISFIGVLLSKTITRPIRELATTANRITTTGNLDEQIPITSQDEVGELTAAFNGMILALRKTRLALEHWNRELEHKVDMRTQELTRSNEKLEQINDQLERANLHKSQFLANMSHELRTPLNAIIGFSEVLQDQVFGELNEKQSRYVNNILTSGRHLLALVNDVLDLSKVEAGKMELHWEEFSARQSIQEIMTQLATLAAKKELEIKTELASNLDVITADKGRFRQIFYNLVSNALKFTPQGGLIEIKGYIEAPEQSDERLAVFSVHDTGIGISAEYLETIFESFRQVDNSYSRQYQGTGLGLALTRKLVEMHGGQITVTSQPGLGSTFTFTLPLVGLPEPAVFTDSNNPFIEEPITNSNPVR